MPVQPHLRGGVAIYVLKAGSSPGSGTSTTVNATCASMGRGLKIVLDKLFYKMYYSIIYGLVTHGSSEKRMPLKPLSCAGLYKTEGACLSSPEVVTKPSPYSLGAFALWPRNWLEVRLAQNHGQHTLKLASRQTNGRAAIAMEGDGFESRSAPLTSFTTPQSGLANGPMSGPHSYTDSASMMTPALWRFTATKKTGEHTDKESDPLNGCLTVECDVLRVVDLFTHLSKGWPRIATLDYRRGFRSYRGHPMNKGKNMNDDGQMYEVYKDGMENANNLALNALKEVQQAFREIHHAQTEPNWFTRGKQAADAHARMWENKGVAALSKAITALEAVQIEPTDRLDRVAELDKQWWYDNNSNVGVPSHETPTR